MDQTSMKAKAMVAAAIAVALLAPAQALGNGQAFAASTATSARLTSTAVSTRAVEGPASESGSLEATAYEAARSAQDDALTKIAVQKTKSSKSRKATRIKRAKKFCKAYYANNKIVNKAAGTTTGITGGGLRALKLVVPGSALANKIKTAISYSGSSNNVMMSAAVVVHSCKVKSARGKKVVVEVETSATQGNKPDWLDYSTTMNITLKFAKNNLIKSMKQDGNVYLTGHLAS